MKEFRLVAFGDSLTYGYGVLSHIAYPFRLARELPEKNQIGRASCRERV